MTTAKLVLKTGEGVGTSGYGLQWMGTRWRASRDDALGGMPTKAIRGQFARAVKGSHTVVVGAAGGLAPDGLQVEGGAALDQRRSRMCCSTSSTRW